MCGEKMMKLQLERWEPIKNVNNDNIDILSVTDCYDGLTIVLENMDSELLTIRWAMVESYCCSTEEARFRFIAGQWQQIRKEFPKWSFFKVADSPYIKWMKEQADGFMDEEEFMHFMIISRDYVLDIVSKHEPDECYKKGGKEDVGI